MVNYIQVENLTKSFGDKLLFENISFGITDNQRVALIAKNGTGKSNLPHACALADGDVVAKWKKQSLFLLIYCF